MGHPVRRGRRSWPLWAPAHLRCSLAGFRTQISPFMQRPQFSVVPHTHPTASGSPTFPGSALAGAMRHPAIPMPGLFMGLTVNCATMQRCLIGRAPCLGDRLVTQSIAIPDTYARSRKCQLEEA